ncbi:MAG: M56 family metallopeptidase [Candidatus Pristimantibacillus sp.]
MMLQSLTSLFMTVLIASLMGIVIAAMIWLVKSILKDKLSPRWSYLLWMLLIIRLVLPWTPESPLSVFNWLSLTSFQENSDNSLTPSSVLSNEAAATKVFEQDSSVGLPAVLRETHAAAASTISSLTIWNILTLVWVGGVIVAASYSVYIRRRFQRQVQQQASASSNHELVTLLETCKRALSIRSNIRLLETDLVTTPTLYGVFRPQLLIPETLVRTLDEQEWKFIFLHELSHLKRKDIAVNWVMSVLMIIHWFNPIMWLSNNRMREDQEIACDSLALTRMNTEESKAYALTLIHLLAHWNGRQPSGSVVHLSGHHHFLKRRISTIANSSNSYRWSAVGVLAILFIAMVTLTSGKSGDNAKAIRAEQEAVEQAVHHYYDNAKAWEESKGRVYNNEYKLVKIEKKNNSLYEAYVSTIRKGNPLPTIPYDVTRGADGGWKMIGSNIAINSKEYLSEFYENVEKDGYKIHPKIQAAFDSSIVAEDENYIVTKNLDELRQEAQAELRQEAQKRQ